MRMLPVLLGLLAAASQAGAQTAVSSTATAPFPHFESGPTRPLLLAPDGSVLYALNTADARVEIYATDAPTLSGLELLGSVFTGLEPVSMALHPADADVLFVANLLSDTVSVVDLPTRRVRATIDVGDEPADVIVVGDRLFVATARSAGGGDLIDPGEFVDNAVVVARASAPYEILERIGLPAHEPRALAAVGDTVYVIPLNSGNHTTSLNEFDAEDVGLDPVTPDAFDAPFTVNGALLAPQLSMGGFNNNPFGTNMWEVPDTARIVMDDEYPALTPQLADNDVLAIDATALSLRDAIVTGVGTTLLGMAPNPVTGDLWITNTDAGNRTRFEPRITGQAFDNRVTIVTPGARAPHAILSLRPPLLPRSHAQPGPIAFWTDGASNGAVGRAYVAALGTAAIVVLDAASGAFVDELDAGQVPIGLAVDDDHDRLYVLSLVEKSIRSFDIAAGHAMLGRPQPLAYDPEPTSVSVGRRHLYDARPESGAGTGNMSCASCHVFGHTDFLAWDLGNPEGGLGWFYTDLMTGSAGFSGITVANNNASMTHPMKGPMVTQSLRGLDDSDNSAPMHWRGDRRFFQIFRNAFRGLLGGTGLDPHQMQEYAAFVGSMTFPPNPLQSRDRVYTGGAARGFDLFGLNPSVPGKVYNPLLPGVRCVSCHKGNFIDKTEFTGSQKTVNFDAESQLFNTATLRGDYEKVHRNLTGFGLTHDGALGSVFQFLDFAKGPIQPFPALTAQDRFDLQDLVMAWDTGTAPLVGAQITGGAGDLDAVTAWLALAREQAEPPADNVDLIAKLHVVGATSGTIVGAHYRRDPATDEWSFLLDVGFDATTGQLLDAIESGLIEATFTCVPPGTGRRFGIDRDEDDLLDGLERRRRTDPTDPDTDGDGYADGLEEGLGGHPGVASITPVDGAAPGLDEGLVHAVFADTASLRIVADEPVTADVTVATAAANGAVGTFGSNERRRRHDLVLDGLPAGTELTWTATLTDTAGNTSVHTGSFTTRPPMFHVSAMGIGADGVGRVTVTATVNVVDHTGAPVEGVDVRGIWAGDIGTNWWFPSRTTDADGIATFALNPYTPSGPTTLTFSPAYVGSTTPGNPYYVGAGGQSPPFFYNQSFNQVNFVELDL